MSCMASYYLLSRCNNASSNSALRGISRLIYRMKAITLLAEELVFRVYKLKLKKTVLKCISGIFWCQFCY